MLVMDAHKMDMAQWLAKFRAEVDEALKRSLRELEQLDVPADVLDALEAGDYPRAAGLVEAFFSAIGHPVIESKHLEKLRQVPYVPGQRWVNMENWAASTWVDKAGIIQTVQLMHHYRNPGSYNVTKIGRVVDGYLVLPDRAGEGSWPHGVYLHPDKRGWFDVDWEGKLEKRSSWSTRRTRMKPNRNNSPVHPAILHGHNGKIAVVRDPFYEDDARVEFNIRTLKKEALAVSRKLTRSRAKVSYWAQLIEAIGSSYTTYCTLLGKDFGPLLPENRQAATAVKVVRHKLEQ